MVATILLMAAAMVFGWFCGVAQFFVALARLVKDDKIQVGDL